MPPPATRPRWIHRTRGPGLALLSLASFVMVAAALRARIPPPTECYLRAKFDYYAETREQFDVVCIGSSQVFRSIVPEILDDELQRRGLTWSTFNLGVPGMVGFETDYYLARILEDPPERLRLVVLELRAWTPGVERGNNTRRTAFWHDFEQTRRALSFARAEVLPLAERWQHTRGHLRMGALRFASVGLGPLVFESARARRNSAVMGREELVRARGYRPTELDRTERTDEFRRNYAVFERMIANLRDDNEPAREGTERELLEWHSELARRAGVRLVYVLPPVATIAPFRYSDWSAERPRVFAYNRPREFPDFYEVESRADRAHLSLRGATLFSHRFGADLAQYLAADGALDPNERSR